MRCLTAVFCLFLSVLAGLCMPARGNSVPRDFWGMHVLQIDTTPWPTLKFSIGRMWDVHYAGHECDWQGIERARGVYDWTCFDHALALLRSKGLDVVYTFGRVPGWANGNRDFPDPPLDFQDIYDFQTAIVRRAAGRIRYFDCWNEANGTVTWWTGTMQQVLAMCQHLYGTVHSLAPGSLVMTPSTYAQNGIPWMQRYLAAGGGRYADVLNIHVYGVNRAWPTQSPEMVWGELAEYWPIFSHYAPGLPLIADEGGFGENAWLHNKPDLLTAWVAVDLTLLASGGVSRQLWYTYDDRDWGTLWTSAGGLNPTGVAYREVQDWLTGATFITSARRLAGANQIRNSAATGAVRGLPGRPPTNWAVSNPNNGNGIATQIVGTGTEGGIPYLDWRVFGITRVATNDFAQISFEGGAAIASRRGQYWSPCLNIRLVGGTLIPDFYISLAFRQNDVTGRYIAGSPFSFPVTPGPAPLAAHYICSTMRAAVPDVAFVQPVLTVNYPAGAPVDMTLRIGSPTMDSGTVWAATIRKPALGAGYQGQIVWDAGGGPRPWYAGSYTSYRDVRGASHGIVDRTVGLTNIPVLLETIPSLPRPH